MSRLPGVLLSLAFTAPILAQTQQQPVVPTLHATAKLVIVDVVVRDASHHPIHGLKQGDFTLFEDGKPQAIKSFEEFSGDTPVPVQPVPKLPPGVFINLTPAPGQGPLNILLLDKLDTAPKDQANLRLQLLKYIDTAKPGTRIALFELGDRLRLLQGFTDDREMLRATLNKDVPVTPKLSDTANQVSLGLDNDGWTSAGRGPANADDACPLCKKVKIQRSRQRSEILAEVMRELARYAAGMSGRKNLLWFSGDFPLYFVLTPGGDPMESPPSDSSLVKESRGAADMLASSQVAVYPVDARGLKPMVAQTMAELKKKGEDQFNGSVNREEFGAMTGGRAFVDTNNFDEVTAEAIDDGSNYYTIAYTPNDTRWNGDYRHIKVQVQRPELELSYRQGFYADDPNVPARTAASKPGEPMGAEAAAMSRAMNDAMEYGTPNATQIVFIARVLPTGAANETALATGNHANKSVAGPYRRYAIDFSIDPHAVAGMESADGMHHAMLEFVTFVYGADAKLVNTVGKTIKADIPRTALAEGAQQRIPAHEEISVPAKGDYFLHIAVHDLGNDHIGSIEIPVSEVRGLAVDAHEAVAAAPAAK